MELVDDLGKMLSKADYVSLRRPVDHGHEGLDRSAGTEANEIRPRT